MFLPRLAAAVLLFFIAGLLYLLRFEHVDNWRAYRIPSETGLLIPSDYKSYRAPTLRVMQKKGRPDIGRHDLCSDVFYGNRRKP